MTLHINGVEDEDTFAEGFKMWGTRVIITAKNRKWALEAATKMTGFATSVIGCKCEAGIEGEVTDTPDGRPGFSVLLFTPSKDDLSKRGAPPWPTPAPRSSWQRIAQGSASSR